MSWPPAKWHIFMVVATMSQSMKKTGTISRCASIDLNSVQHRSKYGRIFPEFCLGICIGVNFNRKLRSWTESWIGKYLYYDCYEIYRESSYDVAVCNRMLPNVTDYNLIQLDVNGYNLMKPDVARCNLKKLDVTRCNQI